MSMSQLYDIVDDIQELCYTLTDALQLQELLNFSLQKISDLKQSVVNKVRVFQCQKRKAICDNTSSPQTVDLKQKFLILEREVAQLKKQLEQFSDKGTLSSKVPLSVIPELDSMMCFPSAPPPPPPPPPPPSLLSNQIVQLRKPRRSVLTEKNVAQESRLDMVNILRGIKDVKLRQTEKSPGGTPMRRIKFRNRDDPNEVIKEALKKRFECMQLDDSNGKENFDDSWEQSSPNRSFTC